MRIELKDIHKHYGGVKANNGVNLVVEPGTIHGVLGENGAGKSTLMKILSGFSQKTSGRILLDDRDVHFSNPAQASFHGIGMLYQDPLDYPLLSVLENFMIGLARGTGYRKKYFKEKFEDLSRAFEFILDPDDRLRNLTIGERQQLEMMRLLAMGIKVLILDEPTTGISSLQKDTLFRALKKLASERKSVILVSHKLEDVESLCDSVTVLRQGRVSGRMPAPFQTEGLLEMMFGTPPVPPVCLDKEPGKVILQFDTVTATGGRTGLKHCSVKIREKEIVGLAGLEGSGQGVFLKVAAGLIHPRDGAVHVFGNDYTRRNYRCFRERNISFLPGSRLEEGLVSGLDISEHYALNQPAGGFFIQWEAVFQKARQGIASFRIKGLPESRVESLSGGNQQRLLLSFLPENPSLLLLENPTRGLDMESVHWVWQYLQKYCDQDTGIVFSSSELDEILMVADRVLVFFNGSIIKDVKSDETSVNDLGRAIAGKA